jgi:Flp pilus assembly protein TadG
MSPLLRRFRHDPHGGVAILAAVALPLGLGAIGAAVTYSNVTAARASYQKALDAAVLAGTILPGSASASERIRRLSRPSPARSRAKSRA